MVYRILIIVFFSLNLCAQSNNIYISEKLINLSNVLSEDIIDQKKGIKRYDFGIPIKKYAVLCSENYKVGDNYILEISAQNSKSLNFIFSTFDIPKGAVFEYYINNVLQQVFTSKDAEFGNKLSTLPIYGSKAKFVYKPSLTSKNVGVIKLSHIIYGYKDFKKIAAKSTEDVVTCINNVVCPQYVNYQDIKNSVVLLLTNSNASYCTGALVNNTRNDFTPYVLTANHCDPSSTSKFQFNYEASTCLEQNNATENIVSGCIVRAKNENSDFALVEISNPIPLQYTPFYAGWDHRDIASQSSVGIHHPRGSVKKISIDTDVATNTTSSNYTPNTFWRIATWEDGVTLGGSSGSPLFNQDKRIVGQLYGGSSSCTNEGGITDNTDDNYGKFNVSWNFGNTPSTRLKEWLDPDMLNLGVLDGAYDTRQIVALNGQLFNTGDNSIATCNNNLSKDIGLRNLGATTLTNALIQYSLNNGPFQSVNWSGNLATYQATSVSIPSLSLISGNNTLRVYITTINTQLDQSPSNDTVYITINKRIGTPLSLNLQMDIYPQETSWQITDPNNNNVVLFSAPEGYYTDNILYTEQVCLSEGCYDLTIFDAENDGMCCGYGQGSYDLRGTNNVLLASGGSFASSEKKRFCVGTVAIKEFDALNIVIFPNPTNSNAFNINTNGELLNNLRLTNLLGQEIPVKLSKINDNITVEVLDIQNGIYFINYTVKDTNITKKIIFEK